MPPDRDRDFPAVTIAIAKQKGTNAVNVARGLEQKLEELEDDVIPSDVHVSITRNYGETADEKVNELVGELVSAIILVVVLIALTLGWREAIVVATAVPLTFSLTLLINYLSGYTINRVTLFALILVAGPGRRRPDRGRREHFSSFQAAAAAADGRGDHRRQRSPPARHPGHAGRDHLVSAAVLHHGDDGTLHGPDGVECADRDADVDGRCVHRHALAELSHAEGRIRQGSRTLRARTQSDLSHLQHDCFAVCESSPAGRGC